VATGDIRTRIRDILGAFMYGGEASEKKVGVLSGGERTRLAMIRLLLRPVNLLILDEPTNHLDLRSKDVLKEALLAFDGTLIVVSHDRDFLDGLVDKVYEFGGGKVREHLGGIYAFLEHKQMDNLDELERKDKTAAAARRQETPPSIKQDYESRKAGAKALRRAEKAVAEAEAEINRLEGEIKKTEERLSTAEGAADANLYATHAQLQEQLSAAMDNWTSLSEKLEQLRA
ncbi:MAG: ATP-binding cassette domain-containing protein, partial [Tannerella sp.]|jgi:ATP-binding cassette subfamily F protein 3|nr:ATP-binding cassette domain-containing protein [Tannerella sp.]